MESRQRSGGGGALVACEQDSGAGRVRELLGDFRPDQSQILAKVNMGGKSHSEAAEELDLPLGTVKSRVRLAIQKLQGLMEA